MILGSLLSKSRKQLEVPCFEAKTLDDTMWLDMAFVEEQYEELMEKRLKQKLMDVLPNHG